MATPSRSSDASPPSVQDFLQTVARSGLLEREQLLSAVKSVPAEQRQDAPTLAEYLVKSGRLSRFQADKLLQGISRGLIFGPFQILSQIGKGGMGKVYLARDSRDRQLVALKVLPPRRARAKERLLARFQREMELSQRVAHPHLCRTFEVGQSHGIYYLAMEFIPGKTLSRVISSEGPLEVPRAARLMAEVASGLEHAHQQGLIHRDLKPSNILITPHDHAKVLDLGLALMQGEEDEEKSVIGGPGHIVGTMDYISPEQTTDPTGVDGRADVYSLGCTLYFALTGRPPFPGGTGLEKVYRQRKEAPEPLDKLRSDLPPAFVALVQRMMAKDPRQRFPSARAVEEQLWLWTEGSPIRPLDSTHDPDYVNAVTALQTAEPGPDSSWTDLDLVAPETTETGGDQADEEGSWLARLGVGWFLALLAVAGWMATVITLLVYWLLFAGRR